MQEHVLEAGLTSKVNDDVATGAEFLISSGAFRPGTQQARPLSCIRLQML